MGLKKSTVLPESTAEQNRRDFLLNESPDKFPASSNGFYRRHLPVSAAKLGPTLDFCFFSNFFDFFFYLLAKIRTRVAPPDVLQLKRDYLATIKVER